MHLNPKMTDLAPKKFAATLGFIFCLLITATLIFNFATAAIILTSIMAVFALLESLFAVCVGCYVYTFLQILKKDKA
jgi:predicted membrane protein